MTEPTPRDELLTGRNEATPVRLLGRVALVIFVVVAIIAGIAYGLWSALN
jgi:hypothetical protein